jgi:hypothetical protein
METAADTKSVSGQAVRTVLGHEISWALIPVDLAVSPPAWSLEDSIVGPHDRGRQCHGRPPAADPGGRRRKETARTSHARAQIPQL